MTEQIHMLDIKQKANKNERIARMEYMVDIGAATIDQARVAYGLDPNATPEQICAAQRQIMAQKAMSMCPPNQRLDRY